jgi:hypothetical protein
MPSPKVKAVELVLEEWMGPMAKFVLTKQLVDAGVEPDAPSEESLNKLIYFLETRCLTKIIEPNRLNDVREDLKKAIATPVDMEESKVIELNKKITDYLRNKFGDVAVYTLNLEKKRLGISEVKDPKEYLIVAEQIQSMLKDMVGDDMAKQVYLGLIDIIKKMEEA